MKTGFRSAAVVASICLALGAAACGGDDGGSDEDQVRELAGQLLDNDPAVCDKATDKFLDRLGGSKKECEEGAEDSDKVDSDVKEVKIDGNEATASIEGERDGTINFVKEDGDWKIDSIEERAGASDDTTETEAETTTTEATGDRTVEARAAGDAFLSAARSGNEAVICGLLDEEYAKTLTGASEFGIAECVEDLKGKSFNVSGSVKTTDVSLDSAQETGTVSLSNGKDIDIRWDGSRFVITKLGS